MPIDPASLTVALADTRWMGHHPTFFREFMASLRRLGVCVLALCPEPEALSRETEITAVRLAGPARGLIAHNRDNDPLSTLWRWVCTRRALEEAEARSGRRADLVFFPYLDNYLRFLPAPVVPDAVLGVPWSGLYFRNQHFGWPPNGSRTAFKQFLKGDALLRSRTALPLLGVLDERFADELRARTGREALPFPDITDETIPHHSTPLADKVRREAAGRAIIGLAGSLEKRKGLLTLFRVALQAKGKDPWYFVAAGPFSAETFSDRELAWIEKTRQQLRETLYFNPAEGRIPDGAPYNALFHTFDVAWAAYEEFQGSSNTLTKAALFQKPVLATEGECIASRVRAFRLGECFPEGDAHAAHAALRKILAEPEAERDFATYRAFHSRPQLDATFQRLMELMPSGRTV